MPCRPISLPVIHIDHFLADDDVHAHDDAHDYNAHDDADISLPVIRIDHFLADAHADDYDPHDDHFLRLLQQLWFSDGDDGLDGDDDEYAANDDNNDEDGFDNYGGSISSLFMVGRIENKVLFTKQKLIQQFCFSKCHDKLWEVVLLFWQAEGQTIAMVPVLNHY